MADSRGTIFHVTLARKMFVNTAALVVSLLIISGVGLFGLQGLSRDLDFALDEYKRLEEAYDVGVDAATVKALLSAGAIDDPSLMPRLDSAIVKIQHMADSHDDATLIQEALDSAEVLRIVKKNVETARSDPGLAEERLDIAAKAADELNRVIGHISRVLTQTQQIIRQTQGAANTRRNTTIAIVLVIVGVMVIAGFIVSIAQYRGVMLPLDRLRRGVRRVAQGQFDNRLEQEEDREFDDLARDFNQMASQLDGLYRDLEDKVREKSKELVRSERLASVGFLAAGVAHEINNPLGIISGYAELSLRRLENGSSNGESSDDMSNALKIICDEAFRCKKITQKLLTLARAEPEAKGPVSIGKVVRGVADTIEGLPRYRDRQVIVKARDNDELTVVGNETQMNQVLLNLTINALEAVSPRKGRVVLEARRRNSMVEMLVSDNGRGMTSETLDRVFEPFYTEKRTATGASGNGTGLGLAITHAIVEDHEGKISAESEGLGKGSRFIVQLPAESHT